MSKLWELNQKINEIIDKKGLDKPITRGRIGLKSGVLMAFNENTPDDQEKIQKIRDAVKEVLGEAI